jgi:hypothetical protein
MPMLRQKFAAVTYSAKQYKTETGKCPDPENQSVKSPELNPQALTQITDIPRRFKWKNRLGLNATVPLGGTGQRR